MDREGANETTLLSEEPREFMVAEGEILSALGVWHWWVAHTLVDGSHPFAYGQH